MTRRGPAGPVWGGGLEFSACIFAVELAAVRQRGQAFPEKDQRLVRGSSLLHSELVEGVRCTDALDPRQIHQVNDAGGGAEDARNDCKLCAVMGPAEKPAAPPP